MAFIIVSLVVFIALLLELLNLTGRFASPQNLPLTTEWIEELSIDRYRPMLRLLNQDDIEFMRSQLGFTPKMATEFRIQRCQIFRGYLHHLDNDFKRICMALKILMVQSEWDRPDLASALVRSQMTFAAGMMVVQFQVVLYRYGIGSVDVADLVKLFDGMRLELRTLVPAGLGAAA